VAVGLPRMRERKRASVEQVVRPAAAGVRPVVRSGLEQADRAARVLAQPGGEHAPGRAAARDHDVEAPHVAIISRRGRARRSGPSQRWTYPQVFERPATFGVLTVTVGVFAAQVASRATVLPETFSEPPAVAVLPVNTRSRPTLFAPTWIDDAPKTP